MSHQHTTQTSGQGMLERVFKLREHGTTARTEVKNWMYYHPKNQRFFCEEYVEDKKQNTN